MEPSRSKRRRLMSSYVSLRPRPDLPAIFESLNDDMLTTILQFVGNRSYATYAGINKHCKEVYLTTKGMTKETFLYGHGPFTVIMERYNRSCNSYSVRDALSKGVVFYNRCDVLDWALDKGKKDLLHYICYIAGKEGRIDVLKKVWNNIDDEDDIRFIFEHVDGYAARHGKLNVLEWIETKGLYLNKEEWCTDQAAHHGQLHILKWLREEKGFKLTGKLYHHAINGGGHLHVMKWLREQACPLTEYAFRIAAKKGNLNILQWLHEEGCPWPDDRFHRVNERMLKTEVVDWLRVNGYGGRLYRL